MTKRSEKLKKELDGLLSIADMRKRFKAKGSQIHYWRRKKGLPALVIPGEPYPVVRFVPTEVAAWDKQRKSVKNGTRRPSARKRDN